MFELFVFRNDSDEVQNKDMNQEETGIICNKLIRLEPGLGFYYICLNFHKHFFRITIKLSH